MHITSEWAVCELVGDLLPTCAYGTAEASRPVGELGCAGLNTVSERKPYKSGCRR